MVTIEKDIYDFSYKRETPREDALHRHMHNGYELLYFLRGDAEYVIGGATYRLSPRTLLFIRPRDFHYLRPLSDAPYERFVIHFPHEVIPSSLLEFAVNAPEVYRVPKGSETDAFFAAWESAERTYSKEDLTTLLAGSVPTLLLRMKYGQFSDTARPTRENPTLDGILAYIDEHPRESITAATLAARFFVSTSWIVHSFRTHLGITLMQYVNKKRILYAEARIREGAPPTAVAKECGYESYVTFYRQFKKYLGYTPSDG